MIDERQVFELFHGAFDAEPRPGAFDRLQAALARNPVRSERRAWIVVPVPRLGLRMAGGIAAVVLVAIVVGSFSYIRAVSRPHTVAPPITSPSPKPPPPSPSPTLTQPLSVDPATPVILFNDAGNSNQLDGMTWSGQAGKITQVTSTGSSNPDGTLFAAFPYIYDRSGRVVAELKGGPYADPGVDGYFVGTWADDERHYCQVVPIFGGASAVTGTLQLTTPGGTPHDVAHVGTQAAGANTLTASVCSVLADRAVVIQADTNSGPSGNPPLQYWVVQLSSGRVLWTHNLGGSGIVNVVASRDGRYVAEAQASGITTVYGPNGSPVGHVNGFVQTFSWDGSLAVVVANGGQARVTRWSDGTVIWTEPPGDGLSAFQSEPGGSSLAILTVNSGLYVVGSDGRVIAQREMVGGLLGGRSSIQGLAVPPQVLPQVMVGDVGWADGPQRTTDGGLHWRDASPPTPPNPTKGGYSSYLFDTNHAWVTMATGVAGSATNLAVFSTADGGQTWSRANVPINGAATESARLAFVDSQHGWLITDSGQTAIDKTNTTLVHQPITRAVYSTADGGLNWTLLAIAHEADGSTLGTLGLTCPMNGLTFTSLNDGWLTWDSGCGIGSTAQPPPQPTAGTSAVAVTHDGGRSWQRVDLPSLSSSGAYICTVHQAVFTSSRGVLPVDCGGISIPGVSGVYETSDAGRSWSFRKLPFFSGQLDFVDGSTGFTFGTTGVSLYRTTNGGRDWAVVKRFDSEQNDNGLSFVDSKVGSALTSRYALDGNSGYSTMWKTIDGGQTWSVMSSVPTGPRHGCC